MSTFARRVMSTGLAGLIGTGLAVASAVHPAGADTLPVTGQAANVIVGLMGTHQTVNEVTERGSAGNTSKESTLLATPANPAVSARGLDATVSTDDGGAPTSTSTLASATIAVPGAPIIATAVRAEADRTFEVATGSTTIGYLKIGSTVLTNITPKPNTVMPLPGGLGTVTLNEQIYGGDGISITVNAIHVSAPALGLDVVLSAAAANEPLDEQFSSGCVCTVHQVWTN